MKQDPNRVIAKIESSTVRLTKEINAQNKSYQELSKKLLIAMAELNRLLFSVRKTNECVEESLGLAVMAINQNKFLHTHYPAQHGFPEVTTPGRHPAKIPKKTPPSYETVLK